MYTGSMSDTYLVVYIFAPITGGILASLLWVYLSEKKLVPLQMHDDFSRMILPVITLVVGVWAATTASTTVPKSTTI